MGRLIFKQPNGLYGRWSGIVDAFTFWNFTKEDVKEYEATYNKYLVDEEDFKKYYDYYTLDYIIENEGYCICRRAIEEGDLEEDVFKIIIKMGCNKTQFNKLKKHVKKAECDLAEDYAGEDWFEKYLSNKKEISYEKLLEVLDNGSKSKKN